MISAKNPTNFSGGSINTAKKGYSKEYRARKELEDDGWFIVFKSIRNRMGCIDYGNLFDICAYRNINNNIEQLFISCKHFGNSNYYLPHQAEIREFKNKYGLPRQYHFLWLWKSARYIGKGKNKSWVKAGWLKIII